MEILKHGKRWKKRGFPTTNNKGNSYVMNYDDMMETNKHDQASLRNECIAEPPRNNGVRR